jgi:hypothetical protein
LARTLVILVAVMSGCTRPRPAAPLFGAPNDKTGLSADDCRPWCGACDVGMAWQRPSDAGLSSLVDDWTLVEPFSSIDSDPYAQAAPGSAPDGTVCGVQPGDGGVLPRPYRLVTFASEGDAADAGAIVTHFGHCGVCSTLGNLAVYLSHNDLAAPVRDCGMSGGFDSDVQCLRGLGFDLPCAQIWAWNTAHTRGKCLAPCLVNYTAAYNRPDGTLNDCLQCDETQSGPVFKAVAGRTRRNSGVPNAICRPCSEVHPLPHRY